MARLLESVESRLSTDFAMLLAEQEPGTRPDAMCFATSNRGAVAMACGTKYADVHVVLQRWDSQPPLDQSAWEDRDELPFEEDVGAGPLQLGGFEPADGPGLDIDGLGRARIRVLATGRHRYTYGDSIDETAPPEEWLLQLWPDLSGMDAMAGEPRRLAGPLPFGPQAQPTPWHAALHAWRQTGWAAFFSSLDAFTAISHGLDVAQRGLPRRELPALAARVHRQLFDREPAMDTRLAPCLDAQRTALDLLGTRLDIDITTFGDLVTALLRCGLLTHTDDDAVAPNPAPSPVWEVLDLPEATERSLRRQGLQADFAAIQWDLLHLVRWAPDQELRTSPRRIAIRLAVPLEQVSGGFQLLEAYGRIRTEPEATALAADNAMAAFQPRG